MLTNNVKNGSGERKSTQTDALAGEHHSTQNECPVQGPPKAGGHRNGREMHFLRQVESNDCDRCGRAPYRNHEPGEEINVSVDAALRYSRMCF